MQIETAYLCDKGGKSINDDSLFMETRTKGLCVFVGDGLGGYQGGKTASEAAGKAVLSCYQDEQNPLTAEWMLHTARQADAAVQKVQLEHAGEMKTTLVVLIIDHKRACWMHIGDSRLYHFINGKIHAQTADHSVSQLAVMMGDITPDQIRFHPDRSRILRALGSPDTTPEISAVTELKRAKHSFLLCSDGFWEYVTEEDMEKTLRSSKTPQQWLEKMERLLLDRVPPNNDNYTAAAVFVDNGLFSSL